MCQKRSEIMEVIRTIQIPLKDGTTITLDLSRKLMNEIKSAFNLSRDEDIIEKHIKYYLISSMKNAMEFEDDK